MAGKPKVLEDYEKIIKDLQDGVLCEDEFHGRVRNLLTEFTMINPSNELQGDFLIRALYHKGYTQKEMVLMLQRKFERDISERQLRRILCRLGLRRRIAHRPLKEIYKAVQVELENWSPYKGIRAMHKRIRDVRGVKPCYRNDVHEVMRELDKDGLLRRRPGRCKIPRRVYSTKGPNDIWHIDGNDKLRFYGIWIHLGIDGQGDFEYYFAYSLPRLIWLHAGTSNRKPNFIARYFLDAVISEKGCPRLVRADRGKENVSVAVIQTSLSYRHNDTLAGPKSFRYGKSVHNQRAECFNGHLKKSWISMWQSHFEAMLEAEILELSNPIQIHCLQYCFLPIIEMQLQRERLEWNNHYIRKQGDGYFGKPDVLFYAPPPGTANQLQKVDEDLLKYAETLSCPIGCPLEVGNESFQLYCKTVFNPSVTEKVTIKEAAAAYLLLSTKIHEKMQARHLHMPRNFAEACKIYDLILPQHKDIDL